MTDQRRTAIRALWVLPARSRSRRPGQADLVALAELAATAAELAPFQAAVVGSILDGTAEAHDLDVVLRWAARPLPGVAGEAAVEEALLLLRRHGLDRGYQLDGSFRQCSEDDLEALARAGARQTVWKLDSPAWVSARDRGDASVRPAAGCLVTVTRRLPDTDYYPKLPLVAGRRVLRPARDLTHYRNP